MPARLESGRVGAAPAPRKRKRKPRITATPRAIQGGSAIRRERRAARAPVRPRGRPGTGAEDIARRVPSPPPRITRALRRIEAPPPPRVRAALGRAVTTPQGIRPATRADERTLKRHFARLDESIGVLRRAEGQYRRDVRRARRYSRLVERREARVGQLEGIRSTITDEPYHGIVPYLARRATEPIPGARVTVPLKGVGGRRRVTVAPSPLDLALAPLGLGAGALAGRGVAAGARLAATRLARAGVLARAAATGGPVTRQYARTAAGRALRAAPAGAGRAVLRGGRRLVTPKAVPAGAHFARARRAARIGRRAAILGAVGGTFGAEVPGAVASADPGRIFDPVQGKGVAARFGGEMLHTPAGMNNIGLNVLRDIVGYPAIAIPAISILAQAIGKGMVTDDWADAERLWEDFLEYDPAGSLLRMDFKDFVRNVQQHPLFFVAEAAGAYRATGRFAARRVGHNWRETRELPLGGVVAPQDYSPNLFTARLQKRLDAKERAAWQASLDNAAARQHNDAIDAGSLPPDTKRRTEKPLSRVERRLAEHYQYRLDKVANFWADLRAGMQTQQSQHMLGAGGETVVQIAHILGDGDVRAGIDLMPLMAVFAQFPNALAGHRALPGLRKLRDDWTAARAAGGEFAHRLEGDELANNIHTVNAIQRAIDDPTLIPRAREAAALYRAVRAPAEAANYARGILPQARGERAANIPEFAVFGGGRRVPVEDAEGNVTGYRWERTQEVEMPTVQPAQGLGGQHGRIIPNDTPGRLRPGDNLEWHPRSNPDDVGAMAILDDGSFVTYPRPEFGPDYAGPAGLDTRRIVAELDVEPDGTVSDVYPGNAGTPDARAAENALARAGFRLDDDVVDDWFDVVYNKDTVPYSAEALDAVQALSAASFLLDKRNFSFHLDPTATPDEVAVALRKHLEAMESTPRNSRGDRLIDDAWLAEAHRLEEALVGLDGPDVPRRITYDLNKHLAVGEDIVTRHYLSGAEAIARHGLPENLSRVALHARRALAGDPDHDFHMMDVLRAAQTRAGDIDALPEGIHRLPDPPYAYDAMYVYKGEDGVIHGATGVHFDGQGRVKAYSMIVDEDWRRGRPNGTDPATGRPREIGTRLGETAIAQHGLSPTYGDSFSVFGAALAEKSIRRLQGTVETTTGVRPLIEGEAPPVRRTVETVPEGDTGATFVSHSPRATSETTRQGLTRAGVSPVARTGESILRGSSPMDVEQVAASLIGPMARNIRQAAFNDVVRVETLARAPNAREALALTRDPELRARGGGDLVVLRIPDPDESTRALLDDLDAGEGLNLDNLYDISSDAFQAAEDWGTPERAKPGDYIVVGRERWQRHKDLRERQTQAFNRSLNELTTMFKRSVLPWSPNWYLGNAVDTSMRALVQGQLPTVLDRVGAQYKTGARAQEISAGRVGPTRADVLPQLEAGGSIPPGLRQAIDEGRVDPESAPVYHILREAQEGGGPIPQGKLGGPGAQARASELRAQERLLGEPTLTEGLAPGGMAGTLAIDTGRGIRGAWRSARGSVVLRRFFRQQRPRAMKANSAFNRWRERPNVQNALDAINTTNQFLINLNAGLLERSPLISFLGKEARAQIKQMHGRLKGADFDRALRDWVAGHEASEAQIALAQRAHRAFGNWLALRPWERAGLLQIAPFYLWLRAAFKFVYVTMPRDHPILLAITAAAASATEEERRLLGLDLWTRAQDLGKGRHVGPLPAYLQGAIPGEGGSLYRGINTITSFGVFTDGFLGVGNFFVPQFSGFQDAAAAIDFKGDPLSHVSTGRRLSVDERAAALVLATAETFIPALALSHRTTLAILKPGHTSGALPWETYGTKKGRLRALTEVVLPPLRRTTSESRNRAIAENVAGQTITVPIKGKSSWYDNNRRRRKRITPTTPRIGSGGGTGIGGGGSGGGGGIGG